MTISATEAKLHFGRLLDSAQRQPVVVNKNGRAFAVMLSKEDYDAMQQELQDLRSQAETDYLLATEANRKALERSRQDREAGRLVHVTMEQLEAMARDAD